MGGDGAWPFHNRAASLYSIAGPEALRSRSVVTGQPEMRLRDYTKDEDVGLSRAIGGDLGGDPWQVHLRCNSPYPTVLTSIWAQIQYGP